MSIELKIKSKHLTEEAKIIKFEERKILKKILYKQKQLIKAGHSIHSIYDNIYTYNIIRKDHSAYCSLNSHRTRNVRNENRATFLARAYIAGMAYDKVESKRKKDREKIFQNDILPRVFSMVAKYGNESLKGGDWTWQENVRKPSKQLKDKIIAWCALDCSNS